MEDEEESTRCGERASPGWGSGDVRRWPCCLFSSLVLGLSLQRVRVRADFLPPVQNPYPICGYRGYQQIDCARTQRQSHAPQETSTREGKPGIRWTDELIVCAIHSLPITSGICSSVVQTLRPPLPQCRQDTSQTRQTTEARTRDNVIHEFNTLRRPR